VLEEHPQRVEVGGGQGAHQVTHTAAALGMVLQLCAREGQEMGIQSGGSGLPDPPPSLVLPFPQLLTDGEMNWLKCEKGKRGSGSSRKKSFRVPVIVDVLPAPIVRPEAHFLPGRGEREPRGGQHPGTGWGQASPWSTL
jgi:hypothetical protein